MVKDHEPQNNLTITDTGGNCPNNSNALKKTVEVAKFILDAEAPLDHNVGTFHARSKHYLQHADDGFA